MDYPVFFAYLFFSLILVLAAYFLSWILRYKPAKDAKKPESDCDFKVIEKENIWFQSDFAAASICFLFFESACVLIFPFAYAGKFINIYGCIEIMIFIMILILILLYSIKSNLINNL